MTLANRSRGEPVGLAESSCPRTSPEATDMMAQRYRPNLNWLLALTCVLALWGLPQNSDAAEYQTASAGGGSGSSFALRCANDQVLVGIGGKASALVDRVQPLCAQVDPLGRWVGNDVGGSVAGGGGGTAFTLRCPRDHAVSGIQGKAGSLIDQLRIKCGSLTAGPKLASVGSVLAGQAGSSGGNAFGPFDCVDNKPGRGLIGRAGNFVDQLRLACDFPAQPLRPTSASLLVDGESRLIARVPINALMAVHVSSVPLGTYRIPVRNNNPSIAATIRPNAFEDSRNPGLNEILAHNVGCTSFDVGFPGDPLRRVELLVAKGGGPALTLSLNIVEWREGTTNAFGTLTTSNPAPAGGISVTLTSSHPNLAIVPTSVTIPAGSRTTSFEIRRSGTVGGCVVITANGNGVNSQSPILFRALPPRKGRPF